MVRGAGFEISDDGNVLDAVNALTDEQAATIAEFIYQGPVPMGGTSDGRADNPEPDWSQQPVIGARQ
jgi:hypothetical protein